MLSDCTRDLKVNWSILHIRPSILFTLGNVSLGTNGRQEINDERKNKECEYKSGNY